MMAVRPRGETDEESRRAILAELEIANIEVEEIRRGDSQPDGSTIYWMNMRPQ